MRSIPSHHPFLPHALETTHSQLRNLRSSLASLLLHPIRRDQNLLDQLSEIDDALASGSRPEDAARRSLVWSLNLTDWLSSSSPSELSPTALQALSRLASALLVISELQEEDESPESELYREALQEANSQLAVQCLILELSKAEDLLEEEESQTTREPVPSPEWARA